MSQNVQTFPDPKQREAIVTDMLLGVIKTGKLHFDPCRKKQTFFLLLWYSIEFSSIRSKTCNIPIFLSHGQGFSFSGARLDFS